MLLSFLSIYFAFYKNWIPAAILAGLCALTKNQGVILSICLAFLSASNMPSIKEKIRVFILSGFISGSIFSVFLIYQNYIFTTPFAFIQAQEYWGHIESKLGFFRTFILQNPDQNINIDTFEHHGMLYLMLLFSIPLWRLCKPIFFYCVLCQFIQAFQGDFANSFRFSSFLFP